MHAVGDAVGIHNAHAAAVPVICCQRGDGRGVAGNGRCRIVPPASKLLRDHQPGTLGGAVGAKRQRRVRFLANQHQHEVRADGHPGGQRQRRLLDPNVGGQGRQANLPTGGVIIRYVWLATAIVNQRRHDRLRRIRRHEIGGPGAAVPGCKLDRERQRRFGVEGHGRCVPIQRQRGEIIRLAQAVVHQARLPVYPAIGNNQVVVGILKVAHKRIVIGRHSQPAYPRDMVGINRFGLPIVGR